MPHRNPVHSAYWLCAIFVAAVAVAYAEDKPSITEKLAGEVVDVVETSDAFQSGSAGTISFPVEISIDELQSLVNEKAPDVVEKDKTRKEMTSLLKNEWVEYHFHRGDIELVPVPTENVLGFSLPISGKVSAGGKFLKIIPASGSVDFKGTVVGSVRCCLNCDWTPNVQTAFNVEFDKAKLKLFHVGGFSIKDHLTAELQKRMPDIQKALHKELDKLALQKRVEPFWAELHKTIRMSKKPESWIQVRPYALALSPLRYDTQRRLLFDVQVTFDAITYLGEKPPDQVPGAIPQLGQMKEAPTAFNVSVPSYLSLNALGSFVTKQFFPLNVKVNEQVSVVFVKLNLKTAGEKLAVTIDAEASGGLFGSKTPLTLNATAVPKLDAEKRELHFEELKYTVETQNYLAKSASVLLEPVVLGKLQEKARFEFGALLEKSRDKVNDIMLSKKANKNVEIKVHFEKMRVSHMAIVEGQLVIYSDAEGDLAMKLHPAPQVTPALPSR